MPSQMQCLLCLEMRNESEEHVFPLALGGTLTTMRVCKPCNDRLGAEVDSPLIEHLLCQIKRSELGLPGNSGHIPNPIVAMMANAYLASDPERLMEVRDDGKGGFTVKHRHHEKKSTDPDGNSVTTITIDASRSTDVIKIIERHRKRAGLKPLSTEEKDGISADLPGAIQTIEQPELLGTFKVDIIEYQRGIIKIAYELACLWLGDGYLRSTTANALRILISAPIEDITRSQLASFSFGTHPRLQGWGETPVDHVAFGFVEKGIVIIAIRIFDSFSAAIVVCTPSDRVLPERWKGRYISINPATGTKHETNMPNAIQDRIARNRPSTVRRVPHK